MIILKNQFLVFSRVAVFHRLYCNTISLRINVLVETQAFQTHIAAMQDNLKVCYNFLLSLKAVTLIFISGRGSVISSAKQGKSGSFYNLVNH